MIGIVGLPPESPSRIAFGSVEAWIKSTGDDEARILGDQLDAAWESFAVEFDMRAPAYTAEEEDFVAVPLPVAVAQSIDVAALSSGGLSAEIEKVEFRWRLDVIGALQQMLAERQ
ncbi:hypothetical protein [Microcella sp.]|uniref:hypothetical protein n=1 Tax=Microcella sp. TaxID=1913979 RepID=UPI00299F577B|nr:hypothetical protein [Microcella sp.]MDX2026493.1 hypothetical protein [Microcella sp.]